MPKKKQKKSIDTVQIVLGRLCNLNCAHCPVDAGPHCSADLLPRTLEEVIIFLSSFPEIKTVELTGGEPGMHNGFMRIIQIAHKYKKEIIVRTNLIIFLEKYFEDIPEFMAQHKVRVLGSFPCVNDAVVESLMGKGVFKKSVKAMQLLNEHGYGIDPTLKFDLIHYPPLPEDELFLPPPSTSVVQKRYKTILKEKHDITFNDVYVMLHIPTGRMKKYLLDKGIYDAYLEYLEDHLNNIILPHLKKNAISIDYNGMIFKCNPRKIDDTPVQFDNERLTLSTLLQEKSLDFI